DFPLTEYGPTQSTIKGLTTASINNTDNRRRPAKKPSQNTCVVNQPSSSAWLNRCHTMPAATHNHAPVRIAFVLAKSLKSNARLVPAYTIRAERASPARQKKLPNALFPLYFASRLVRRNKAWQAVFCME